MGCATETPPQGGGRFCGYYGKERPGSLCEGMRKNRIARHTAAGPIRFNRNAPLEGRGVSGVTTGRRGISSDGRGARHRRAPLEPSPGGQSSSESLLGRWDPSRLSRAAQTCTTTRAVRSQTRAGRPIWLCQQKTPLRGGGAFLGLLQGGEICISVYVDRWEVGRALDASRVLIEGVDGHRMGGARPNREDRLKQTFHRSSSANP